MTNNRKPVDEVRLSLSAARKREAGTHLYERLADKDMRDKPYTPPPNVAAWLKAQADKPKAGRDIESLMRYHKAHKKGRTDDDCLREKFGSGGVGAGARPATVSSVRQIPAESPAAPTPLQPLPSASTKPHGKDVDTADGPWPRCLQSNDGSGVIVYADNADLGTFYGDHGRHWKFHSCYVKARAEELPYTTLNKRVVLPLADAIAKLEQNGHKDVAAQLRGKPRADVATGGGRVWEDGGFAWVQIGGVMYSRVPVGNFVKCVSGRMSYMMPEWEIFGHERDAILAECRKAMVL